MLSHPGKVQKTYVIFTMTMKNVIVMKVLMSFFSVVRNYSMVMTDTELKSLNEMDQLSPGIERANW